jgi:hypothetical protein
MDIHNLIAAISPDVFCDQAARKEVKGILRDGFGRGDRLAYHKAAEKARIVQPNRCAFEKLALQNAFSLPGFKSPVERHSLAYDCMDDSIEWFYFWVLDELEAEGWNVTRLLDNFEAAPGSGLRPDHGQQGLRAQQQAARMLREIHRLVPEILRSAKELGPTSSAPETPRAKRPGNDEVQRTLLQSKVETLALYARWLGPYLREVQRLKQESAGGATLVKAFNTAAIEVTLLAERPYPLKEAVDRGELPKVLLKAKERQCFPVILIELRIRAAPERTAGGGYTYRGRVEVVATSYALNQDELSLLRREVEYDDFREVIGAVVENAQGTLSDIISKIETLLSPEVAEVQEPDDPNPFSALFDFGATFGKGKSEASAHGPALAGKPIPADSDFEAVIRSQAILDARKRCLVFYEHEKQRLQMPLSGNS